MSKQMINKTVTTKNVGDGLRTSRQNRSNFLYQVGRIAIISLIRIRLTSSKYRVLSRRDVEDAVPYKSISSFVHIFFIHAVALQPPYRKGYDGRYISL